MPKFQINQPVCHIATGYVYIITCLPSPLRCLECGAASFYEYTRANIDGGTTWLRSQIQMEDGRFVAVPHNSKENSQ